MWEPTALLPQSLSFASFTDLDCLTFQNTQHRWDALISSLLAQNPSLGTLSIQNRKVHALPKLPDVHEHIMPQCPALRNVSFRQIELSTFEGRTQVPALIAYMSRVEHMEVTHCMNLPDIFWNGLARVSSFRNSLSHLQISMFRPTPALARCISTCGRVVSIDMSDERSAWNIDGAEEAGQLLWTSIFGRNANHLTSIRMTSLGEWGMRDVYVDALKFCPKLAHIVFDVNHIEAEEAKRIMVRLEFQICSVAK